ncbi:MAG TPA: flagellar hook-associated protein FlgK [Syntrophales bacterium]|nr:flagellar hook-associated protein FlgK [Syntrophales bacterium]
MSDLFQIMNTTKQAILSHTTAISVTSGNIANVNTEGYSRLRPVFGSKGTISAGAVDIEVGVEISTIERIYNRYLETQVVEQAQDVGYNQVQSDLLGQVDGIFDESDGGGINELMSAFWNAWSDLSASPEGYEERDALVSAARNLTQAFQERSRELTDVQADANETLASDIESLNGYLSEMADLNDKIVEVEITGGTASDLRDKRSTLLKTVSGMIELDYYEASDGSLSVFLSDGRSLVEGGVSHALDVVVNPSNGNYYDIVFESDPGTAINDRIHSGQIAGLLSVRDDLIPGYLSDLDDLANNLVSAVNSRHGQGFDLNGDSGGNFFSVGSGARDMEVDAAILADSGKIAAATTVDGNGDNALGISQIQDSLIMKGNTLTVGSFYSSLVSRVGGDVQNASRSLEHQTLIQEQYETSMESLSGVSLDEEMMNLIRYQMGYNAAGKLCAVVSEMMDTLIALGE